MKKEKCLLSSRRLRSLEGLLVHCFNLPSLLRLNYLMPGTGYNRAGSICLEPCRDYAFASHLSFAFPRFHLKSNVASNFGSTWPQQHLVYIIPQIHRLHIYIHTTPSAVPSLALATLGAGRQNALFWPRRIPCLIEAERISL